jgi:hypothetical protein
MPIKNELLNKYTFDIIGKKDSKYNKNLFVCYTPFHILVSLLIACILKRNNDDVCDIVVGKDHFNDASVIMEMIKSKIPWIDKVDGINDKKVTKKINNMKSLFRKTIKVLFLKGFYRANEPKVKQIKLNKNVRIFLFNDSPLLSLYFLKSKGGAYFLVEDGKANYNSFKNNNLKNFVRKIFKFYRCMGRHPKIKKILVQRPNCLPGDIRNKGIELNLDYLIDDLNEKEKIMICNAFPGYKKFYLSFSLKDKFKKRVLLLTQPLSEDGLIDEEEKINLYEEVIRNYHNKYKIFLKPHPRENTIYENYFSKVITLPQSFPIELLKFDKSILFDLGISYSSSSIDNLDCIKQKIILKNKKKYFKGYIKVF